MHAKQSSVVDDLWHQSDNAYSLIFRQNTTMKYSVDFNSNMKGKLVGDAFIGTDKSANKRETDSTGTDDKTNPLRKNIYRRHKNFFLRLLAAIISFYKYFQ